MKKLLVALLISNIIVSIFFYYNIPKKTNVNYTLNNSTDLLERCNPDLVPSVIKSAQKNVIGISVEVSVKDPPNRILKLPPISLTSRGTGFLRESNVIVSARHVFLNTIFDLKRIGFPFLLNMNSIPESDRYEYKLYAIYDEGGDVKKYPLTLIAMGRLGEHRDYMVLKAKESLPNIKPLETGKKLKNGDVVYNGAYLPIGSSYPSITSEYNSIITDVIKCNFKGRVSEVIKNMPVNLVGVDTYYRIAIDVEPGYSGGPIFNTEGQVAAMILATTKNFTYAISIQEIDNYIKNIDRKNIFPKK